MRSFIVSVYNRRRGFASTRFHSIGCNHCSSSGAVAGQFTPAPPTCPDNTFNFTCNVTGDMNGTTTWRVGGSSECHLVHRTGPLTSICGPDNNFTANSGAGFDSGTPATYFTSTLSGTAYPALNGTLVECFGPANNVTLEDLIGEDILKLKGQCWSVLYAL